MSQEKQQKNNQIIEHRSVMYSAPLPEASQFAQYNQVVDGAGDRIIAMAEKQARHRQFIEKWSIVGDQIRALFGLLAGLIVAIAGLGGAVFLILNDKEWAGSFMGATTLASIVGSFIYGSQNKLKQSKQRESELND